MLRYEDHHGSEMDMMYTVIEAYYDEAGNLMGGTSDSEDTLVWDNLKDLKRTAEQVLQAFDLPVVEYVGDGDNVKLVETDEWADPDAKRNSEKDKNGIDTDSNDGLGDSL